VGVEHGSSGWEPDAGIAVQYEKAAEDRNQCAVNNRIKVAGTHQEPFKVKNISGAECCSAWW